MLSLRKQKRMILSGKSLLQQHADSKLPKQEQGRRTDHERDITAADFERMRKEVDILGTVPCHLHKLLLNASSGEGLVSEQSTLWS